MTLVDHCGVLLPNGTHFIYGGSVNEEHSQKTFIYDLKDNQWKLVRSKKKNNILFFFKL